jgi:pyrroline-5-carboxylate reductase
MSVDYLVVGAGRMGGALISGWLSAKGGAISAQQLLIVEPKPQGAAKAAIEAGARHIDPTKDAEAFSQVGTVLLAIKPQAVADIAPVIAPHLPAGALVISILAGTSIKELSDLFPAQNIIRAMPNTPAAVGAGITAFTCTENVSAAQKRTAQKLLAVGGAVHEVESEHLIDVVTAVSGSGPAYVFHMAEALEAAAIKIGLPEEIAPQFARQTIIGAAALLEGSDRPANELRQAVTSPNGTTQAALDILMPNLPALMRDTVKAALTRAKELARGKGA